MFIPLQLSQQPDNASFEALLWWYVAGNNKMYWGLHIQCTDFNRIWNFLTVCYRNSQYHISRKSVHWEPRWYTNGQTRGPTTWHHFSQKERVFGDVMSSAAIKVLESSCKGTDNFNKIRIFSTDFHGSQQYRISRKCAQWVST